MRRPCAYRPQVSQAKGWNMGDPSSRTSSISAWGAYNGRSETINRHAAAWFQLEDLLESEYFKINGLVPKFKLEYFAWNMDLGLFLKCQVHILKGNMQPPTLGKTCSHQYTTFPPNPVLGIRGLCWAPLFGLWPWSWQEGEGSSLLPNIRKEELKSIPKNSLHCNYPSSGEKSWASPGLKPLVYIGSDAFGRKSCSFWGVGRKECVWRILFQSCS